MVITDFPTAELVKVAANSFLATKISFINAMAEICETTGADVTQLATAIGHDDRIGHQFLRAGLGFGGGCLPKDIRAFMARAGELGVDQALSFLKRSTRSTCAAAPGWSTSPARCAAGSLAGVRVAVSELPSIRAFMARTEELGVDQAVSFPEEHRRRSTCAAARAWST